MGLYVSKCICNRFLFLFPNTQYIICNTSEIDFAMLMAFYLNWTISKKKNQVQENSYFKLYSYMQSIFQAASSRTSKERRQSLELTTLYLYVILKIPLISVLSWSFSVTFLSLSHPMILVVRKRKRSLQMAPSFTTNFWKNKCLLKQLQ